MKNQDGSNLVILIIIMTTILLYYLNWWQKTILTYELTLKRYKYEKHLRASESLCNLGIVQSVNSYELIKKNNTEQLAFKGLWPENQKNYFGTLLLKPIKEEILVAANLMEISSKNTMIIQAKVKKELIVDPKNSNKMLQKFTVKDWLSNAS